MRLSTILLVLPLIVAIGSASAQTNNKASNPSWESEHQRAVELARNDNHDSALAILSALLNKYPDNYPVRRDYVIIATWKGDCDAALEKYQPIKNHPDQEAYLITPVAECLASTRQTDEALSLLRGGLKAHPDDADIKSAYDTLLKDIELDQKPELQVTLGTGKSDAGNHEYFLNLRYSRFLTKATRWFVRYFKSQADDKEFDTGDLNRLGVGIMHWFHPQWYFEQEFSKEIVHNDPAGFTSTLIHYPTSLWQIRAQYASFAEDIPLRAKALDVDSSRFTLAADYHSVNYRWEWSGSASMYDFSDGNDRESYYTSLGYAYELKENREQRIIGELSHSTNSLSNVVYFNPESDVAVTVTHRTTFVLDSQYDRHVDHLSLFVGQYDEKNYSAEAIYGIRYEQEYDFNDYHSLSWGAEYASRVYDGDREMELSFVVTLTSKI